MLLNSYKITRTLPCLADPGKIRVIAEISDGIYEAIPYLDAILKRCIHHHPALTLTIKKGKSLDIYREIRNKIENKVRILPKLIK